MESLAPMGAEILARIFAALEAHRVRYVVFGGIAVNARGVTRATEDIDLFLEGSAENVAATREALDDVFHDPELAELTANTMQEYGLVRYGPPHHNFVIDLTTRIGDAFDFEDIEHTPVELYGHSVPIATAEMLLRMKRNSTREKDRSDVVRLSERYGIEVE